MPNTNRVSDNIAALILGAWFAHLIGTRCVVDGQDMHMMCIARRCGVGLMQVERWLRMSPVFTRNVKNIRTEVYSIIVTDESLSVFIVMTDETYIATPKLSQTQAKTLGELLKPRLQARYS